MTGLRRLGLGVCALALLGACAQPLPTPQPDAPASTPVPAVTEDQVQDVLGDVVAGLAAADAAGSVDAAGGRLAGPAATIRAAEYVRLQVGDTDALTVVPGTAQTVITPATDTWPRVLMVVTEPPADLRAPLLLTIVQDGPRDPYRLWAWSRLLPGTEMPATAQPGLGSAPVAGDAADLTVPLVEVMPRYLDVLSGGAASAHAATFAEDRLRTDIAQTFAAFQAATAGTGSAAQSYAVEPGGPYAVRTADGGALVVGAFRTATEILLADSTLTLGDTTSAFLGGTTTLTTSLQLTSLGTAAFHVPAAGSDQPVRVLGGEQALVAATGS